MKMGIFVMINHPRHEKHGKGRRENTASMKSFEVLALNLVGFPESYCL